MPHTGSLLQKEFRVEHGTKSRPTHAGNVTLACGPFTRCDLLVSVLDCWQFQMRVWRKLRGSLSSRKLLRPVTPYFFSALLCLMKTET